MLKYLKDLWNEAEAALFQTDPLELLRYRSNLLGADLRITNFGGGNTSSKYEATDPLTGKQVRVMAVKGSGGDLGSIKSSGFAVLYLDRLLSLESVYKGEAYEDEMVGLYPSCAFAGNTVATSIDTPLHAFLPFDHVDHLHPDWAIALAASRNGKAKMEEFNARYGRKLVWLPWQRPGFELGLMLRKAVTDHPGCDGILLASHGLFTWGNTQRESYLNSITIIDQLGDFVLSHQSKVVTFGGPRVQSRPDAQALALSILPKLRGKVGQQRRSIAHFDTSEETLTFVNSQWAKDLAALGTSCPDHFVRTRIAPLYADWDPTSGDTATLEAALDQALAAYREAYTRYYHAHKEPDSPPLRDQNPTVVLLPGIGMVAFGRSKKEARITSEFYRNAIRVMMGATAMAGEQDSPGPLPHAKDPARSDQFTSLHNYVALPPREAFRIEYWLLEEAKLRRLPPEKEFSRKIFLLVGAGAGIGRAAAVKLAAAGAHLMIADLSLEAAQQTAGLCAQAASDKEAVAFCEVDLRSRATITEAIQKTVMQFGGLDGVVNTAAIFLAPDSDILSEEHWRLTLEVNVTGNYFLAKEAFAVFAAQQLPASIVLTSSANAVVAKKGSEAYDVSKSAVNHLIGELAVGMAPLVRVNGVAPATVVSGSTMFPRDRVISSLRKYQLPFDESESTEQLRSRLAQFYADRTLLKLPIEPEHCAEAILFLASDRSARTSGCVIPVDGGLTDAFLR
ncbi:MAG: bifunctional rhamnulose-1-phosphate aldolase/short-chain dehydrogenase [Bryobacteraceae bacterium]|nr:bifunctional rhamnulose-1-phosphate aldolase/short-chain dehydrogenase [Bryobacteraceae bacterium]MDW8378327.1 bifunctional rhamnulose-1-phosphate aldolase/short-chain dehydrogenase [Bryobacterales bacterium]